MPTRCPPAGSCGTSAQVWLDPRNSPGTILSRNLSDATLEACVSWNNGVLSDCCLFTVPVTVKVKEFRLDKLIMSGMNPLSYSLASI